jgi:hypothetical protein
MFKEITLVYNENHTQHINTKFRITDFKAGGAYSYHWVLGG